MSINEVPPGIKEQLARYEQLQQSLQAFLVQKQQIEVEIVEIDKAVSELNKANEKSKIYKSAGTVMISSNKEDVEKELNEAKELAKTKLTVLNKQENRIKENIKELQTKLDQSIKNQSGNQGPVIKRE